MKKSQSGSIYRYNLVSLNNIFRLNTSDCVDDVPPETNPDTTASNIEIPRLDNEETEETDENDSTVSDR